MDTEQLKIQIEKERNLLHTDRLDVSFGEIMRMYEDKEMKIKKLLLNLHFKDIFVGMKNREHALLSLYF
jgi:hypothetical protein